MIVVCARDKSPLGQHLDKITPTELVAKVSARAQNNDLTSKMPTIKRLFRSFYARSSQAVSSVVLQLYRFAVPVCTRSRKAGHQTCVQRNALSETGEALTI